MLVREDNFEGSSPLAQRTIELSAHAVAISQADALVDSFKPGYAFQIVAIEHFAEDLTAAASYDVKIGETSALAAAEEPTAATREDATLNATLANLKGAAADEINLHATTDGSGDFTGLKVRVTIRPQGTR